MKLSCADFSFPLLPFEKSLDLVASLGMEGVDVGLFEGRSSLWPSRELDKTGARARLLREQLADRRLVCADIFLQCATDFASLALNHPDKQRRAKAANLFRRLLIYAAEVGSQHVTILPGVSFREVETGQDSFARAVDELSWRVNESAALGIICSVEAHIGSIISTPERALKLVRQVPGLTLTLDYTHFTSKGISDAEVEPLCAHSSHLHVRGARKGRIQCSFKENTIDYKRVATVLRSQGYQGWVGLEYVWIDWEHCNECDNISETILFRNFVRAMKKPSAASAAKSPPPARMA